MNNQETETTEVVLHPATKMGLVTIAVVSLERSISYYTERLGFTLIERTAQNALLGEAAGHPLLALVQQEHARPQPAYTTGLYHFAILVPTRLDLGRVLAHLAETRTPLAGYADHLVSEALYLSDPDGNGIEIYRDRPRENWNWEEKLVVMASDPIDIRGLLDEARNNPAPWTGLPAGTTIGHMHLRVASIAEAEQFYHSVLGFTVTQKLPGALFVSAGGYHHHMGLNTWQSQGAPRPPQESVGLRFFTIHLPNEQELATVVARLHAANWPIDQHGDAVFLHDPWGNGVLLTTNAATTLEVVQEQVKLLG